MEMKNQSVVSEFILVGLTSNPDLQVVLFGVFTLSYAAALIFNLLLIFAISTCKKLHTPMYFLLVNLSLVNMICTSTMTPKMLQNFLSARKTISYSGCMAQFFFFISSLATELLLLSFMAFDRYAAICQPLQYTVIMRKEVCVGIAACVWLFGMANGAVHTSLLLQFSFCDSNVINHFFCNLQPLQLLACSDTSLCKNLTFLADAFYAACTSTLTLTSYGFILRAIIRIRSTEGKKKAFSTCSSHLIVVSVYFSTVLYTFSKPPSASSLNEDKLAALLFSTVTPILNPLIYSLRNKDVKEALKQFTGKTLLLQRRLT